jgi:hypothetical protein
VTEIAALADRARAGNGHDRGVYLEASRSEEASVNVQSVASATEDLGLGAIARA